MSDPRWTILVTNDDGIQAPGIQALADALERIARVIVVAPESQQSAAGHAITLHKPVRLQEVTPNRFACSGTPVDCTYLALNHLLDSPPDLVASGINHGPNLGNDVIYSGTVAGAREATLLGVKSIAFSLAGHGPDLDFTNSALIAAEMCEAFLSHDLIPQDVTFNVNFPKNVQRHAPWVKATLGRRRYTRAVTKTMDPRGKPYYWIGGTFEGEDNIPGSDCNILREGAVSVTPVHTQSTCNATLDALSTYLQHTRTTTDHA